MFQGAQVGECFGPGLVGYLGTEREDESKEPADIAFQCFEAYSFSYGLRVEKSFFLRYVLGLICAIHIGLDQNSIY